MSSVLQSMIRALDLEIAAIKKKGGGTQVELRGGERVGQAEGSWLYSFVVTEDLNLRDDTPVRVAVGQEDVRGVIVSLKDGVLLVALEQDLGLRIAAARLVADDAFLIERLMERLQKVQSGEVQHCRSAAERAIGQAPPDTADVEPHPSVTSDGALNADQMSALRRSLGSDTTFVWGPPGTGKTTTLARIVEGHYRAGRSVLLVSNTNIAVDTALERVAERLKGEPEFHQGLVIRQGPVVKEELRCRFGSQVILDEIVARLGEGLHSEKDAITREAASLEAEERSLAAALRDLETVAQARQTLEARSRARETALSTIDAREREANSHRERAAKLAADLERARRMGAIRRFFSGLNPERLERERAAAERQAQAATEAARALAADIPKLDTEIAALQAEVNTLLTSIAHHPPEPAIRDRLQTVRERLREIHERIATIDRELATLEQEVLGRCRILATTVYRTYLGSGLPRQFDAVVIDEASMLMPPLVYYVAGLGTSSVTVAGDFRQLPPIVISDGPLAEEWLKCDVFEKAGIPKRLAKRQPTPHLVALGIQYRMREPICAVINDLFYADRPLRTDPAAGRGGGDFPLGTAPLLYVDTTQFHPWTALRVGTYSRYNLFHALLVRNIVLHLAETGFLPPAGEPNEAVGAVAPYASQARLIQALLDDRLGERAVGIAATVHRFQGNEKRVMLLDFTDSLGVRLGRFLRATRIEEDGARLLNVAVSRARHHVVLVGNFEYLRAKAPRGGFVHGLIEHFETHGEALNLGMLLPLAERDWIDGLHQVLPAGFDLHEGTAGVFTEGTFYPAFARDLERATKSIVILSPFATGPGTARWAEALRAAVARGVRVRVVTRPAEEFGVGGTAEVSEVVRGLREIGVTVDLRARMHEKVAILDGRILWHGSLNILSHRDTSESMLRLKSPAACRQLGRFLSPPAGRREEDAPAFAAAANPECPKCGGPTVWRDGRYGIWFECEDPDCDGKIDARRRGAGGTRGGERRRGTRATGSIPCPEPGCSGTLRECNGRYGAFLGCSNYPKCRHTEPVE
ncbi:AAA domain-containing protein [Inmirania thermothiophila]|uniref:Topoisomerase-like DNA binding C4 zinc finger protein n=1 Tax=Inmirania thermothiophila TaxID=1750597 RepID=A0A3N1Y170_9GAMM|nr:AAA domain-containing protein [Inmirania thermothiophila]ROR32575.1 topoisomerase-like DNA binding C4 zinc finger protein [Inmirania thermothiophila]